MRARRDGRLLERGGQLGGERVADRRQQPAELILGAGGRCGHAFEATAPAGPRYFRGAWSTSSSSGPDCRASSPRATSRRPGARCACSRRATGSAGASGSQRDALAGLDLDMGGAWVADCQPHVWSEADRYGVAREHDALPTSVRWRFGDAVVERALPVDVEDLGELERAVAALLTAARRHDATRPPDAQGLEDLDVPAGAWIEALGLPRRVRELLLFWISACASARAGRRVAARVPALDLRRRPPALARTSRPPCSAGASRPAPRRCTRRSPPTCAARSCSATPWARSRRTATACASSARRGERRARRRRGHRAGRRARDDRLRPRAVRRRSARPSRRTTPARA